MKHADPRVKLLWAILCTGAALLFVRPVWMLGACLFAVGGTLLFGARFDLLLRRLQGLIPFFAAACRTADRLYPLRDPPLLTLAGKWR